MRDPLSWSFTVGRVFGIKVRIHILFPCVALGLILRQSAFNAWPSTWIDAAVVMGLLFLAVLLHELGHCFMARRVGGDASEVLLWPLGGLATLDVPHSARAHFLTAAGGPLVNLVLCVMTGLTLIFAFDPAWRPPLSPLWSPLSAKPIRDTTTKQVSDAKAPAEKEAPPTSDLGQVWIYQLNGVEVPHDRFTLPVLLSQFFWVNWILLLINVLLIGYPLDGGKMFQCLLWPHVGYRQATAYAVYAGFGTMFFVLIVCLILYDPLLLLLVFFIYASCTQQWLLLETGTEDYLFGYDFSQGYTSLEKDRPVQPRRKQPNFFQRWLQRRAARKLLAEQQRQLEDENRMDQLLEKIQRFGKDSLTEEEHRFLKKVADRYRNRH